MQRWTTTISHRSVKNIEINSNPQLFIFDQNEQKTFLNLPWKFRGKIFPRQWAMWEAFEIFADQKIFLVSKRKFLFLMKVLLSTNISTNFSFRKKSFFFKTIQIKTNMCQICVWVLPSLALSTSYFVILILEMLICSFKIKIVPYH